MTTARSSCWSIPTLSRKPYPRRDGRLWLDAPDRALIRIETGAGGALQGLNAIATPRDEPAPGDPAAAWGVNTG